MATNDELLATIDAKLSALLKVAVENQSRPAGNGAVSVPTDLAAHAASLEALLAANGPAPAAAVPPPPPLPAPSANLADALDEIARLLALTLKRKRDLADVVAELDSGGIERARIGELLGASPSRVDAALASYDRRARKKRRQR